MYHYSSIFYLILLRQDSYLQRYFSSLVEKMVLSEDDLHHIKNVMRGKISDRFELVFDSQIHLCEITSLNPFDFRVVEVLSNNKKSSKALIHKALKHFFTAGDRNRRFSKTRKPL